MKTVLIAGLGFGDEGKGSVAEFLTHVNDSQLTIRYNGGSQAAHNVVEGDGRHHTFSQFGSGTYQGARTFLSRFMLVDPLSIFSEARHLEATGVTDPLSLLTIDRRAPLVTQYHRAANRIQEYARGGARHGSCGVGVGEVMKDMLRFGDQVPFVSDVENPSRLAEKLDFIRKVKQEELRGLPPNAPQFEYELLSQPARDAAERYRDVSVRISLVDSDYLSICRKVNTVFEGAQGVLLDQSFGFQPHTTWTNITFDNAETLLREADFKGETHRVGVVRTYSTRHGAGPFVTEDVGKQYDSNEHNCLNAMQGGFRCGSFDLVLLRYALEVIGGVGSLAVTHMDCLPSIGRVCDVYKASPEDANLIGDGQVHVSRPANYQHQEALAKALARAKPSYRAVPGKQFIDVIESAIRTKVSILSSGPRLADKQLTQDTLLLRTASG